MQADPVHNVNWWAIRTCVFRKAPMQRSSSMPRCCRRKLGMLLQWTPAVFFKNLRVRKHTNRHFTHHRLGREAIAEVPWRVSTSLALGTIYSSSPPTHILTTLTRSHDTSRIILKLLLCHILTVVGMKTSNVCTLQPLFQLNGTHVVCLLTSSSHPPMCLHLVAYT